MVHHLLVADGDTNTIDTLDASGLTGDVIVEGVQGYVQLGQSGVNLPGAKIALDANGEDGFETIITGAGNDRLIGNEALQKLLTQVLDTTKSKLVIKQAL